MSVRLQKYDPAKHRNFILNGYLKATRRSQSAKYATDRQFYDFAEPLMDAVLRSATVLVATSPEDDDIFVGFIIGRCKRGRQRSCIDFVYVKSPMRHFGVAHMLLEGLEARLGPIQQHSHPPYTNWQRLKVMDLGWEYNPYSIWSSVIRGKYEEDNKEFYDESESSTTEDQDTGGGPRGTFRSQTDAEHQQQDVSRPKGRGAVVVVRRYGSTSDQRTKDGVGQ